MANWSGKFLTYEEAKVAAQPLPCPLCAGKMHLKKGRYSLFYGCENWPKCSATHGAHPDGQPLGVPADAATKKARIEAHAWFDKLWTEVGLSRQNAYGWLRKRCPDLPPHISEMNAVQCRILIERVKAHLPTKGVTT